MQNAVSAYIVGIALTIVMLIIAAMISNMIAFRPDNSDCKSRKTWFWILGVLTPVLTFIITLVVGYLQIKSHKKAETYMIAMSISSAVSFVLYVALGWIIAKTNKHGKLGNWF